MNSEGHSGQTGPDAIRTGVLLTVTGGGGPVSSEEVSLWPDQMPDADALIVQLDIPVAMDWAIHGETFVHEVYGWFASSVPCKRWEVASFGRRRGARPDRHKLVVKSAALHSCLHLVNSSDGTLALFLETDSGHLDKEVPLWRDAIKSGLVALPPMSDHEWSAVVAPIPFSRAPAAVSLPAFVNGLGLILGPRLYHRWNTLIPSIAGGMMEQLTPVLVHGSVPAIDDSGALSRAAADLVRLCATLTLASSAYWEILHPPVSGLMKPGDLPRGRDEGIWSHPILLDDQFYSTDDVEWLAETEAIITLLDGDLTFADLLVGYYHARSIEATSPSLALVLYTAIIETVGLQWEAVRTCDTCGAKSGYGRAFRQALREAVGSKKARQLGELYGDRSRVAHASTLFGPEKSVGFPYRSMFDWAALKTHGYQFDSVEPLREAAAILLRKWVSRSLPNHIGQNANR